MDKLEAARSASTDGGIGLDVGSLAEKVTRFWEQNSEALILGSGAVLALLVALGAWRFSRSTKKDRWIDRLAAVLVLAWTSEGMWEVATQKLNFPTAFAVATFFVAEAMMLSSGMRANEYRKLHGVPGPSGTLVWILAALFGGVVALAADSPVEGALRLALPLAAVGLWWTGLTAERDTDTDEMKQARVRRAKAREATWAITPRTLLVRWGVMKPGELSTTDAQREHQVQRMVILADRVATTSNKLRQGHARRRLRALTRTADEAMIAEVALRADRAMRAEQLMVPVPPVASPVKTVEGQVVRTLAAGGRADRPGKELATATPKVSASALESAPPRTVKAAVQPADDPETTEPIARPAVKVPATGEKCQEWADIWMRILKDAPDVAAGGAISEDDALEKFSCTARHIRNVRNAVLSGDLRRKASELGVNLPEALVEQADDDAGDEVERNHLKIAAS